MAIVEQLSVSHATADSFYDCLGKKRDRDLKLIKNSSGVFAAFDLHSVTHTIPFSRLKWERGVKSWLRSNLK